MNLHKIQVVFLMGNQYTVNTTKCKNCGVEMLPSYKGVGKKWCSRSCIDSYRKRTGYWSKWYQKKPEVIERNKRLCAMCKRNIKQVGEKYNINKYCSNKCMYLAGRTKHKKQKMIRISIPIEVYHKLFENND